MFSRSILFILTVLFILSCFTSCDMNGKSASQLRQEELIAKLNQEKTDKQVAAAEATDYTYNQKAEFVAEMKKELANLQGQIDQLSAKIEKADEAVKTDANPKITALREELELTKKYIETTDTADEASWESAKNDSRKAATDLRNLFAKTNKMITDKIQ